MDKISTEKKINYIKYWLQCFGDRDNETFFKDIDAGGREWKVWLQYSFDEEGDALIPSCILAYSFKRWVPIEDAPELEVDIIIAKFKEIKTYY